MALADRFQSIRNRLSNTISLDSSEVAVLITVPLDQRSFNRDLSLFHWWRGKDFAKSLGKDWSRYRKDTVEPVVISLREIARRTQAHVILSAEWADFVAILDDRRRFKLIVLVAHHIGQAGKIEFFDRAVRIEKVVQAIGKFGQANCSLAFIACKSERLAQQVIDIATSNTLGPTFFEFGKAPLTFSIEFVNQWLQVMNGNDSILRSYQLGIDRFTKNFDA